MDIEKAVSNEVFKPLVSIAIPGGIAIAPYVFIAQKYIPQTSKFWHDHDAAFTSIVIAVILAMGLMLEDLGAMIEIGIDRALENDTSTQVANWEAYLKLKTKDEYIAQRYIRTLVTRFKFELSMGPAIVFFWLGIAWIQYAFESMSTVAFSAVTVALAIVASFLAWQAWQSAETLARTRILLIEAITTEPPDPDHPDDHAHGKKDKKKHKHG